jgi:hypothetical protein
LARTRATQRVVLAASVVLLAGAVAAAYSESKSYIDGGLTPAESFAALLNGQQRPGLSIASTRLVLDGCYDAMQGVYGRLRPTAERMSVAQTCRELADAATKEMPSYSFAWYVGALAAVQLDQSEGLVSSLRQSQLTGPTEQWLAELRVALSEDNRDVLPEDVRANNDRDLTLLVISNRGITSIAKRYVDDPSFRGRITEIVEQLSEHDQQRFISTIESATASLRQSS